MDAMMSVDDVSFFAATSSSSTKQLTRAGHRDAETLVCDCSPTLTDNDR